MTNGRDVEVTLTGPAKVYGVREPAGKTVTVSTTLALQLAASGVMNPDLAQRLSQAFDTSATWLESDFQEAVDIAAAEKAKVLAETMLVDAVAAAVIKVVKPVEAERDQAKALAGELGIEIEALKGKLEASELREVKNDVETADQIRSLESQVADLGARLSAITTRAEAAEKLVAETPPVKPATKKT